MSLNGQDFITVAIVVVIGILVLKLLSKLVFRVAGIAIFAVIGIAYLYFYTDYFEEHQDNKVVKAIENQIEKHIQLVSLIDFEKKYCKGNERSKSDIIKCECIVEPLLKDLRSKYSDKELKELMQNKEVYLKELLAALKRNQEVILKKLKQRQAIELWNQMVKDLKKGKFLTD